MTHLPTLVFYEKPGCASNAQQKKLLRAVGFELDVRSLLSEPWSAARLREFFGAAPIVDWFNKAAPSVKQGLIKIAQLTEQQALDKMLQEPLLIRRPLIQCNEYYWLGFNLPALLADLGLPSELSVAGIEASEQCSGSPASCEPGTQGHSDKTQRCGL